MKIKKIIKKFKYLFSFPFLLFRFLKSYRLVNSWKDDRFQISIKDINPFFYDATIETEYDRHYIYHTAWAARILENSNVTEHNDFSSSLYFIGIMSASRRINFYDYRKADLQINNVKSLSADLLNLDINENSLESISCMHVLEHIGLGRYGDKLQENGDLLAAKNLTSVLKQGGQLLVVVPIGGRPHIKFNANRVYTYSQVLNMFDELKLVSNALITDYGKDIHFIENATEDQFDHQDHGCGCFYFKKY